MNEKGCDFSKDCKIENIFKGEIHTLLMLIAFIAGCWWQWFAWWRLCIFVAFLADWL